MTTSVDRSQPRVIARGAVERPALSSDGGMLAFLKDRRLRVARADGTGSHVVPGDGSFQWSPRANLVASAIGSQIVIVDAATGSERRLHGRATVNDFAWSPDGRRLAVAYTGPPPIPDGFDIIAVDASEPNRSIVFAPARDDKQFNEPLIIGGWKPDGDALLLWVQEMASGSIMQDGLDLWLVPLDGSEPRNLGSTLVKREWIRWSPDGTHLAIVRAQGRMVIDAPRVVTVCAPDGTCTPIAPPDVLTLDPAWSPDGGSLAFVSEPADLPPPTIGSGGPNWRTLYATRHLSIANADGSDVREITAAGGGVASPTWSSDGRVIVFVRDDALWTFDLVDDRATRVVGPVKPVPVFVSGFQSNLAASDAPYEPTPANGFSTWESLVTWR